MYKIINKTPAKTRLSSVHPGKKALVVGLDAGRCLKCRLESMGLVPGIEVNIISNGGYGPLLVSIGEGRLSVGRGVAEKIVVV